jgi:hypothetical protein
MMKCLADGGSNPPGATTSPYMSLICGNPREGGYYSFSAMLKDSSWCSISTLKSRFT